MQNAIDFKELRRQERERRRRSSAESKMRSIKNDTDGTTCNVNEDSLVNDTTCNINVEDRISGTAKKSHLPDDTTCNVNADSNGGTANNETPPLEPYKTMLPQNKLSDDTHRIQCTPDIDSVLYAQNFLSHKDGEEVMQWLKTIPEYKQQINQNNKPSTELEESIQHNGKWTRLKHAKRKVALFDGMITALPPILQRLVDTLVDVGAFPSCKPPNHVLINEYNPGEGILPHTDGPAYYSRTATISLGGSDVIFKLTPRQHESSAELQQESKSSSLEVILHGKGSLVLFTDDAYLNYCHSISEGVFQETTSDGKVLVQRGYRVSLTFRRKK